MKDIVIVKNLTKRYGNCIAVDDLSFQVKEGSTFGLLGANGSGKSSTIESILGTKKCEVKELSVLDRNPIKDKKLLFEQVGVQFQDAKYQELIKVEELCEITAALYKQPREYGTLLEKFGISDKRKSFVKELSGGERQNYLLYLHLFQIQNLCFWMS